MTLDSLNRLRGGAGAYATDAAALAFLSDRMRPIRRPAVCPRRVGYLAAKRILDVASSLLAPRAAVAESTINRT